VATSIPIEANSVSDHYRQRRVDLSLLRALATLTATRPLSAAELAEALEQPTYTITAKLQALVKTELAARSRRPNRAAKRLYAVTEQGRELLRRADANKSQTPATPARSARRLTR